MTASTLSALSAAWGPPAVAVHVAPGDQLLDSTWSKMPSWAIIPFESIEPRWKVLSVDGQSPIRKDFGPTAYPLAFLFTLSPSVVEPSLAKLPATNRDPSKMTTVIMSGTSSLVREIAYQMEVKGIDYPGRDIGTWLREADITHVSNEVSFDPGCPPPNPYENRFYCSDPRYIGLFDAVGVDVVELTGNHILDNGTASMLYTLKLYQDHNMAYFGGGANLADASKPLLLENHGNKIAFVGCNAGEPPEPLATRNQPGANPCNWSQLTAQIRQLRQQGYLPIVTFQYKEGYSPMVMPWQAVDFRRAAEAGAVIVSGSQSHVPLEMEFYKGTFIHYGLGNLFFGQMGNQPPGPGLPLQPAERFEFLDRHVFYDGHYINTELLTALLEDYARPRPMDPAERGALLGAYFGYSGWLPLVPTPAPEETPTLYPLLEFHPLATHTPRPEPTRTP
jgi:poly-gamma-glutamate synthesis protein (capsule biosynthesis protein)